MVFLFPIKNDIILRSKKAKVDFLLKNILKDDISSIIGKHDIHPRKYGIPSDKKD